MIAYVCGTHYISLYCRTRVEEYYSISAAKVARFIYAMFDVNGLLLYPCYSEKITPSPMCGEVSNTNQASKPHKLPWRSLFSIILLLISHRYLYMPELNCCTAIDI